MEWKPIETAPKDKEILVFVPDKGVYHVKWRGPLTAEGRFGWCICHSRREVLLEFPTLWTDIQEPPK